MLSLVENSRKTLRITLCKTRGNLSTFLTNPINYYKNQWRMFGFSHTLRNFPTYNSTEFLFGLSDINPTFSHNST